MMLTTPALINFLQSDSIESFRAKAYDDKQPHLDLNPGDEDQVKGTITYGTGLTKRPDGSPLQLGDTITRQEDADRVRQYIREEVEPVIENLIHVPLWPSAYDAIGSVIYNFGADEVSRWRLWRRINTGDRPENIALEWLDGTFTSAGEPMLGLYRRRVMEVLMFFNLDWRAGAAISWANSVMEVLRKMNWDGQMPKPALAISKPEPEPVLILDKPLPMEAKVPRQMTLPDEWDKMTEKQQVAYLNTGEFIALGGKVGEPIKPAPLPEAAKVTTIKKTIETPNIKPEAPPKAMETSQTFKGLSKSDSGKETAIIGTTVLGGVAYGLPYADQATAYIAKYPPQTIILVIGGLAGMMALYGVWRWWRGQIIAYEGRQKAEGPKV